MVVSTQQKTAPSDNLLFIDVTQPHDVTIVDDTQVQHIHLDTCGSFMSCVCIWTAL